MKEYIMVYYRKSTGSIQHTRRVSAGTEGQALQNLKSEFYGDTIYLHSCKVA